MAARTATRKGATKGSEDLTATEIAVPVVAEEIPADYTDDPWSGTEHDPSPDAQVDPPEADPIEETPIFVPTMTILVVGSKAWDNIPLVIQAFEGLAKHYPGAGQTGLLVHGGNPGGERQAAQQWAHWQFHCDVQVPLWTKYGRSAGVRRNIALIDDMDPATDVLIAFIKGDDKSCNHAMDYAASKGIKVVRFQDN